MGRLSEVCAKVGKRKLSSTNKWLCYSNTVCLGSTKFWTFRHFLPLKNWNKTKVGPCQFIKIAFFINWRGPIFAAIKCQAMKKCLKVKNALFCCFWAFLALGELFHPRELRFIAPDFFAQCVYSISFAWKIWWRVVGSLARNTPLKGEIWAQIPTFSTSVLHYWMKLHPWRLSRVAKKIPTVTARCGACSERMAHHIGALGSTTRALAVIIWLKTVVTVL